MTNPHPVLGGPGGGGNCIDRCITIAVGVCLVPWPESKETSLQERKRSILLMYIYIQNLSLKL